MSNHSEQTWPETFHWWIDEVGGYLALTKPKIRIGQAGSGQNDIEILADISAHHADLRIDESGTLLLPYSETSVNGKVGKGFLLRDGDRIKLRTVEIVYHKPISWSKTARLELASRHRLPLSLDGVVLLGETCVLGPRRDAHIRAPWEQNVFVNWYQNRFWIRGPGDLSVDGQHFSGQGPLNPTSQVEGPWGAFRWEPVYR